MKRIVALAALVGACVSSGPPNMEDMPLPPLWRSMPAEDVTGNRLEPLVQRRERFCTDDGEWCADATGEFAYTRDGGSAVITAATREEETQSVWEYAIRRDNDHIMLGIVFQMSDMYADDGAWTRVLTLYDVAPGANEATPVVSLPYSGTAYIRACFDEQDRRARRNACLDQYSFAGLINLATETDGKWPRLILATEASTYPGRRSRSEDSTLALPLTRADLVWARDERCSYRRVLTYAEDIGGYVPDAPLPDCPDYFTQ